jgi:hypothetical protein
VPAGVPDECRPLQLVSDSVSRAAKVHASFRAVPIRRSIQTRDAKLNAINPSAPVQVPDVGRDSIRNAIPGEVRAVVVIVAVDVAPVEVGVTELGLKEQDEPAGAPLQVRATVEVKPFKPVTVTVVVAVPPAATLRVAGAAATVKSGVAVVPVPVSVAVCGLLASLSATLRVALTAPVAVGVNVTLIVQLAPAANVVPHWFVCAKDDAPEPMMPMAMPLMSTALLFFSVTVCAALVELTP